MSGETLGLQITDCPGAAQKVVEIDPDLFIEGWVAFCSAECRHHDGKRCAILGHKPDVTCRPWLAYQMCMTRPLSTKDPHVFKLGDRVRHRESGEAGIIARVAQKCVNPKHRIAFAHALAPGDCELEPIGRYDITTGFDKTLEDVPGEVLELAPQEGSVDVTARGDTERKYVDQYDTGDPPPGPPPPPPPPRHQDITHLANSLNSAADKIGRLHRMAEDVEGMFAAMCKYGLCLHPNGSKWRAFKLPELKPLSVSAHSWQSHSPQGAVRLAAGKSEDAE